MNLPSKLKLMNLFADGYGFGGEAKNVKLPTLKMLTEKFSGGGMAGSASWRTGQVDDLKLEYTLGGLSVVALKAMGVVEIDGLQLRFAGAYQRPDDGAVQSVEVVVRGQQNELDMGDAEAGKDTEHKYVVDCVYYKLSIDGAELIEIDILAGIVKFNGVDQNAALRQAAGGF